MVKVQTLTISHGSRYFFNLKRILSTAVLESAVTNNLFHFSIFASIVPIKEVVLPVQNGQWRSKKFSNLKLFFTKFSWYWLSFISSGSFKSTSSDSKFFSGIFHKTKKFIKSCLFHFSNKSNHSNHLRKVISFTKRCISTSSFKINLYNGLFTQTSIKYFHTFSTIQIGYFSASLTKSLKCFFLNL